MEMTFTKSMKRDAIESIPLGNGKVENMANPREEISETRHLVSYRDRFLGGQVCAVNSGMIAHFHIAAAEDGRTPS